MTQIFNYQALVDRINAPPERIAELEACLRRQYGSDEMMFELRMLRTLEAIAQGATTLDEAIREFSSDNTRQSHLG